jgi:hypothetical protein
MIVIDEKYLSDGTTQGDLARIYDWAAIDAAKETNNNTLAWINSIFGYIEIYKSFCIAVFVDNHTIYQPFKNNTEIDQFWQKYINNKQINLSADFKTIGDQLNSLGCEIEIHQNNDSNIKFMFGNLPHDILLNYILFLKAGENIDSIENKNPAHAPAINVIINNNMFVFQNYITESTIRIAQTEYDNIMVDLPDMINIDSILLAMQRRSERRSDDFNLLHDNNINVNPDDGTFETLIQHIDIPFDLKNISRDEYLIRMQIISNVWSILENWEIISNCPI